MIVKSKLKVGWVAGSRAETEAEIENGTGVKIGNIKTRGQEQRMRSRQRAYKNMGGSRDEAAQFIDSVEVRE
ncbi:hypothetical protein EVAR_89463_1 [Eumeta japonica]|uniref:Uncharacterized protein n=1 Tax=Eumeta variegata TaxID=151549 RepID=A0A4C1ZKW3_EUMVA|nr:hypothetical protein EVAR_89463_1 [Eumeta japonica]